MFAYGKLTGVSIEIGEGLTIISPILDGYELTHAIQRYNLGGKDITNYFNELIHSENDDPLIHHVKLESDSVTEHDALTIMKEKLVTISPTDYASKRGAEHKEYTLPNGEVLKVNENICTSAGENIIFSSKKFIVPTKL
eukprot:TRINITY_DN7385_c0_g1_i1.p1 TRINITY_DN7385_c0_g1~~TRINITY_DN7385_c0_g1_i1.p1  ORF type:complete len:139 (+),score=21.34 TRINITY_DN7385_c0_g1_i1:306-722(+)